MAAEDEQGRVPACTDQDVGSGQTVAFDDHRLRRVHRGRGEGLARARLEVEAYHCQFVLEMLEGQALAVSVAAIDCVPLAVESKRAQDLS